MIAAIYAAALGLALVALSLRVIRLRHGHRISVGHAGNPELERAMRVQANFAEYAPLALIMLALAEFQGLPAWAVHGLGLAFLAARLLHFLGFRSANAPGAARVAGMALTFGTICMLAAILPVQLLWAGRG